MLLAEREHIVVVLLLPRFLLPGIFPGKFIWLMTLSLELGNDREARQLRSGGGLSQPCAEGLAAALES